MPNDVENIPRPRRDRLWPRKAPTFQPIAHSGPLAIPLAQRATTDGMQAKPVGASVARKERLTPAAPEVFAAALAPMSGRITSVGQVTLTNGSRVSAVHIDPELNDAPPATSTARGAPAHEEQERVLEIARAAKPAELPLWIDRLQAAGIWADRRTSPDLLGQLHAALRRPVDTIICNLLDSDPSLCLNASIGAQYPWQLVAGASLLAAMVGARQTIIVIDVDAPSGWSSAMRRLRQAWHVQVVSIGNDYPQSDPTLLLYTLLRRKLRPGRPPVEQGAIQIDAATAVAIGKLLYEESAMLSVPIALRDRVRGLTYFLDVPIGMPVERVLSSVGITAEEMIFRAGEMLRDQRIPTDAIIAGGELVIDAALRDVVVNPDPCIRCGWCVEMCPTRLQPLGVLEASQRDDPALAEHHGIEACIECGICSYVCPSHLPLLSGIRMLRARGRTENSRAEG